MIVLLALLIVVLFAGLGFAVHALWILAGVLLVLWLIGFVVGQRGGCGQPPLLPVVSHRSAGCGRVRPLPDTNDIRVTGVTTNEIRVTGKVSTP